MLAKLIANFTLIASGIGLSFLVLIYGWGLTPQSYWWIIGGGIFGHTVLYAMREVVNKKAK